MVHYYLKSKNDSSKIKLEFMDKDGTIIKTYSSTSKKRGEKIESKEGFNRFVWNMRYPDAESFPGLIMWSGSVRGPSAMPGKYNVRLTVDGQVMDSEFEIIPDPRSKSTPEDYKAQFDFLLSVRDKVTETHQSIKQIRKVRGQIDQVSEYLKGEEGMEAILDEANRIKKEMIE